MQVLQDSHDAQRNQIAFGLKGEAMADSAEKTKKQGFFKNVQTEFKKVSWPDRKSMFKQSVAVVAISIVAGVIIAMIDYAAKFGVNFLTSL